MNFERSNSPSDIQWALMSPPDISEKNNESAARASCAAPGKYEQVTKATKVAAPAFEYKQFSAARA